ncbi:MAG: 50S ribosome-binding GTPase, partial [Candidatus Brocadiae bacterium]|nr:50S ribosome-binding GTPase [Candidatus Brocadiia bacterium]
MTPFPAAATMERMAAQGLSFEPLRLRVLEQVDGLVRSLAAIRPAAWADPGQQVAGALLEARRRLEDHIRFRFGRGRGAPAIVVLFGGTGVGKSTLLNTLAGKPVTETSSRRPCTTQPLLYHHQSATEALRAPDFLAGYAKGPPEPGQPKPGSMTVETMAHEDATLASVVLVDAPDYDSVEGANRRTAEDLYRIADLVVFVVNPSKYADEETWKAIRRARAEKKATAWVFNRAEPEDPAAEDFRRLLEGAPVVVIPRDTEAHAAGMVRDPAARDALRGILRDLLLGDAADRLRLAELRRSWDAFASGLDR